MKATTCAVLCWIGIAPSLASAQGVYLGTDAQGIPRQTPAGCTIVTARHAVEDKIGEISIVQPHGGRAAAEISELYKDHDVAVLRVTRESNVPVCREPWSVPGMKSDSPPGGRWQVWTVDRMSVVHTIDLTLVAYNRGQQMVVRPMRAQDVIVPGMSGSPVVVDGVMIGMLVTTNKEKGTSTVLGINYLSAVIGGVDPPPTTNLSGTWQITGAQGTATVQPDGTLVQIDHRAERMTITMEKPNTDFAAQDAWKEPNTVVWRVNVPAVAEPSAVAYGRTVVSSRFRPLMSRAQALEVHTREVQFSIRDQRTIETAMVVGEGEWNGQLNRVDVQPRVLRLTLKRMGEGSAGPAVAPPPRPPQTPQTPFASSSEALQALRAAFKSAGRTRLREVPSIGNLEFETSVKSFMDCTLVIEEQMIYGPGDVRGERFYALHTMVETTRIDLREVGLSDITAAEGAMDLFPREAWAVGVHALAPNIMIHRISTRYGQVAGPPVEQPAEQVHFLTVYKKGADQAAGALRALANACGAR